MKLLVKKNEVNKIGEHGMSEFSEYNLPFINFSTGISELNGLYPKTGFDVDMEVDATWYVESGYGQIFIEPETYNVEPGDMLFVPKGKKFWINGNQLKLVVTSCPPWTPEQHKHLEN